MSTNPVNPARSLRFSLSMAIILLIVCSCLILGSLLYGFFRVQTETTLRKNLQQIAGLAAMLIDPDEHSLLGSPSDQNNPIYQRYRNLIAQFLKINPDIFFFYTLRQSDDGTVRFVLDSGTTNETYSPPGSVYEGIKPEFLQRFLIKDTTDLSSTAYVLREIQKDKWGMWLTATMPIWKSDGSLDGLIALDLSAKQLADNDLMVLTIVIVIVLFVTFFGMIAGIAVSRKIVSPLLSIASDMAKIQRFELSQTNFKTSTIAEVLLMETALENMKKGLRSFRKYVPADVVGQLVMLQKEAVLESNQEDITVFFSDLENFTTAAEKVGVEKISLILGPYFKTMTKTLQDHKATVDKFIGDAVMAFWNAPIKHADHAFMACNAALACARAVEDLGSVWQDAGIAKLRTRIGINTGRAVVGNIGYDERLSYTALGDTVNLASRLESLNKYYGTFILVSEGTWDLLQGRIPGRQVDLVAVKGRDAAGGIYELYLQVPQWHNMWQSALHAYFMGDFMTAASQFSTILSTCPHDGPSLVLLDRCHSFANNPPINWNGVTIMHDK